MSELPCRCGHSWRCHVRGACQAVNVYGEIGSAGFSSSSLPCPCRGFAPVIEPLTDPVNHPAHYTSGAIEVIDFILDQRFGYLDGQVIKYVSRYRHKGAAVEDLRKARWYLDRLIAQTEKAP